jgi:hypothetical protein
MASSRASGCGKGREIGLNRRVGHEGPIMSFSRESLQDHLNFMIEQIELAKESPSDQEAAIDAATSSIPYIGSRINSDVLDPRCRALFATRIENLSWTEIAKLTPEYFTQAADRLVRDLRQLKKFVGPTFLRC